MNNNKWNYKNFNMVVELDIAGEFIYNGIYELNRMEYVTNDAPTFMALYNFSSEIERLQKIILVLWKLTDFSDEEKFEKSLITHSHRLLCDEIKKLLKNTKLSKEVNFSEKENDFITLIQKFYNTARYNRFNITGQNNMEFDIINEYLTKYLSDITYASENTYILMTDQIKEFLGRVVGKISRKYYRLVQAGSYENSTYTYELRSGSKAQKIFLPEYRYNSLMEEQINERIFDLY